tara:strand:+ start:2436 stop:2660 length:225 start_codon:yes stop_codon:yes gene_type:complete
MNWLRLFVKKKVVDHEAELRKRKVMINLISERFRWELETLQHVGDIDSIIEMAQTKYVKYLVTLETEELQRRTV